MGGGLWPTGKSLRDCPLCGKGQMIGIETLPPTPLVHSRSPPADL